MKSALGMSFLLLIAPVAQGADIEGLTLMAVCHCSACQVPFTVPESDGSDAESKGSVLRAD